MNSKIKYCRTEEIENINFKVFCEDIFPCETRMCEFRETETEIASHILREIDIGNMEKNLPSK